MKREISIDRLGRADLSAVRKQDHVKYLAEESRDGTITLVPLVRVPAMLPEAPEDNEEAARK